MCFVGMTRSCVLDVDHHVEFSWAGFETYAGARPVVTYLRIQKQRYVIIFSGWELSNSSLKHMPTAYHFFRVACFSNENKMPISNLAKVFGPTIVGYSSASIDMDQAANETPKQEAVSDLQLISVWLLKLACCTLPGYEITAGLIIWILGSFPGQQRMSPIAWYTQSPTYWYDGHGKRDTR